jgi:hypothetical protein
VRCLDDRDQRRRSLQVLLAAEPSKNRAKFVARRNKQAVSHPLTGVDRKGLPTILSLHLEPGHQLYPERGLGPPGKQLRTKKRVAAAREIRKPELIHAALRVVMRQNHFDIPNFAGIFAMKGDGRAADDPPRVLGVPQECRKPRQGLFKPDVEDQSAFFATATSAGRNSRSFIM